MMFEKILTRYGFDPGAAVLPFGDGLINHTWKVHTEGKNYILQQVNHHVFKSPADIDQNLNLLKNYLSKAKPEYLFISPIATLNGDSLVHIDARYYRMFPFVEGSKSLNALKSADEAYEAAKQFAKFSKILADFEVTKLNITIPDFHNLSLRYDQYTAACRQAPADRLFQAKDCIAFINEQQEIVHTYFQISNDVNIPLRVIHHDTKISNVLFDNQAKGLCVIDLDTVMPGYFFSDVGDMMRTYLCGATEEETDFEKITIRKDFFTAVYRGYMEEMGDVLTLQEKQHFFNSGKFIIYMQGIRFLTDFLQNDCYYGAKYEGHNLNRATNQIVLLRQYLDAEKELLESVTIPR